VLLEHKGPVAQLDNPCILDGDDRWQLVERILATPDFLRSPRLSEFLRYVARATLEGSSSTLSEQHLGEVIFGRPPNYDSTIDSIVRSHALRLRQRLDQYFTRMGQQEPIRLHMPRGGYTVVFEPVELPSPPAFEPEPLNLENVPAVPVSEPENQDRTKQFKQLLILCIFLGISSLVLLCLNFFLWHTRNTRSSSPPQTHPLWSTMFSPGHKTTLVVADSALALFHGQMKSETSLDEYLSRNFQKELRDVSPERAAALRDIGELRYTSFVDLGILSHLESLPQARQGNFSIKYARDLHMSDLKDGNVILSGSSDANPWVELFEPDMNFVMQRSFKPAESVVLNRHPLPGEQAAYIIPSGATEDHVYGVIAFLPNLDGGGHALILEGSSLAGTEAVSDFLFDDVAFVPFLAHIRKPDGSLPHFEILLESNTHGGNAGRLHILTYRTYR